MLVLVDTFSGWVEAYPTRTEKSSEAMKALLRKIVSQFALPSGIQSNNGDALASEIRWKV